jgi:hypothetical protein
MNSKPLLRAGLACLLPLLACSAATAAGDASGRPQLTAQERPQELLNELPQQRAPEVARQRPPARDPMQAPPEARAADATAAAAAPAAAPAPARHLMVVDGQRWVVSGGRKRGVGDLLGDARIERIEDSAVVVRQDGVLHRLPLFGDVQRRPAPESASPVLQPPGASTLKRPARPSDAGALSLARPERPSRPEARLAPSYRAGDPQ